MLNWKRFHFIGIGGIGMSGLARLLLKMGYEVSGSDLKASETTRALAREGARIFYGHHPRQVHGAEVVVYSSAIKPENPELVEARRLGLEVMPRAEMLVEIMKLHRQNIVVAGAHGKTTTSSMLGAVLSTAGLSPTVAVGGKVNGFEGNAWLGCRDYLVAEADESDGSFLRMAPDLAVITNIDAEHLDYYASYKEIEEAFLAFANRVRPGGALVVCADDQGVQRLLQRLDEGPAVITYGVEAEADFTAKVQETGRFSLFTVYEKGRLLGEVFLRLPGLHNVQNALATIAVARRLRLPFEKIRQGLSSFKGVRRRFELKGEAGGIAVFDDYAHHPTEIKVTISAFKKAYPERRLVVVFQPHRYTRTKALFGDFSKVFDQVDVLLVTEIYPAAEIPLPGVSGEALYQALKTRRKRLPTYYAPERALVLARLLEITRPGDLVVTMGAGDIYRLGEEFLKELGLVREEVA